MFIRRGIAALATALALTACGSGAAPGPSGGSGSGPVRVVSALYPLTFAAERVGGEAVEVTTLTAPGVEPHDLELTPQQVAAIQDADLVIYIPGLQPAVDDAVAAVGDRALDASAGLTLLPAQPHEDEGEGDEGHAEESTTDPHVWLNPLNMAAMGQAIGARLAAIRPDAAAALTTGEQSLSREMGDLDRRWSEGTAACESRDLVVSHEAFGYLAAKYGFEQLGISGISPDAEPSPATVARVADFVRANKVRTIYYETLVDPKVAQVLATETGAATAVLDPIEGVAAGSDDTYVSLMDANLAAVVAGQPCG